MFSEVRIRVQGEEFRVQGLSFGLLRVVKGLGFKSRGLRGLRFRVGFRPNFRV